MSDTLIRPLQPPRLILEVTFDPDQEDDTLDHRLFHDPSSPPAPDPNPTHGKHANSLYFQGGEEVALCVIGRGARTGKDDFVSFQIVDCTIITRPQIVQRSSGSRTLYAPPSLFTQATGATYQIGLDFAPHVGINTKEQLDIVQNWKQTLNVSYNPGMWELSFTMTVRISRGIGVIDEVRVFSFDPEAEVGSTGTMP